MNRRKLISAALGLGALAVSARFGAARELSRHQRSGVALGTTVTLIVLHEDAGAAEAALDDAMAEIKAVDALMSLYRDDSQLVRLNRESRLADPDPRLREVLAYARALSEDTAGAFDVTVQPLWTIYAAAAERGALPSAKAIAEARARVDWRRLVLAQDAARLDAPGMAVTLNGVNQGYAADRALAALKRHGIAHALIDAGEFDALGRKADETPWTLGIQHPRDPAQLAARLVVDSRALATSGDYQTFFTPDFVHNHIFDPATGESPTELAAVSVLAPTALDADGLSTAFMVLGAERSLSLAARRPGVEALLIGKDGRHWRTPGLPALEA